jgi:tRNA dimethylallyltransferase
VHALTGRTLSDLSAENLRGASVAGWLKLVVAPAARAALAQRLERRFDAMLEAGLVAEVGRLRARGDLGAELPAIRSVGYRQLWAHLEGRSTLAEARIAAIAATRQLAKRQYTWLKAEPDAEWFDTLAAGLDERLAGRVRSWNLTHCKQSESVC